MQDTFLVKSGSKITLRCWKNGGFYENGAYESDKLVELIDVNMDKIVRENSVFQVYMIFVEIIYFIIIAQEHIAQHFYTRIHPFL